MILFMAFLVFLLLTSGSVLLVSAEGEKIPPKIRKRLSKVRDGEKKKESPVLKLAKRLAVKMKLPETLTSRYAHRLSFCGIDKDPAQFIYESIIPGAALVLISVPILFVSPVVGSFFILTGGALIYVKLTVPKRAAERVKEKIEADLSWVVFTVSRGLSHSRDVVGLLEKSLHGTGPEMERELVRTISEMKSGHAEAALMALDARVGSELLSSVVRGLISMMQGDDTETYFALVSEKLSESSREKLKTRAGKVPKKVRKLSLISLVLFLLTYVVVIGQVLVTGMGGLFL